MIFVAETSGIIPCRMIYDGDKNKQLNDIPYSKLFGFISEHIFETIREVNKNFGRDERTMEEIFKDFPIEYTFIYKKNKDYNQGVSAHVGDYQPQEGSGFGNKPSNLNRLFNMQLVIVFKFVNEPEWIQAFFNIWKIRPIMLKGTMDIKKSVVDTLNDITFDFDRNKVYYTFNDFTKSPNDILNPNKMLFMLNHRYIPNSIYVENVDTYSFSSAFSVEDIIQNITLHKTSTIIGL